MNLKLIKSIEFIFRIVILCFLLSSTAFAADLPKFCDELRTVYTNETLEKVSNKLVFYSGSFDPPTRAHIKIIQTIACGNPKNLVVLVNRSGSKNFKTASFERVQMLKETLKAFPNMIHFQPEDQRNKNTTQTEIAKIENESHFTVFIGEDSFYKLPTDVKNNITIQDENKNEPLRRSYLVIRRPDEKNKNTLLDQLVKNKSRSVKVIRIPGIDEVSSTLVRESLWSTNPSQINVAKNLLNSEVFDFTRKRSFYRTLPATLEKVQTDLFAEDFYTFRDSFKDLPALSFNYIIAPEFEPQQSPAAWVERYINWVISSKYPTKNEDELNPNETEIRKFQEEAEKLLLVKAGDTFYPRLAYITYYSSNKNLLDNTTAVETAKQLSPVRMILPQPTNKESHTIKDLNDYIDQRFPAALQNFLNSNNVEIFLHNGSFDECLIFHKLQGYSEIYPIQISRGNPMTRNVLVRDPNTNLFRMVLHSLRTEDRKAQLVTQLSQFVKRELPVYWVEHPKAASLFELNEIGKKMEFHQQDLLLIGMQSAVREVVNSNSKWQRTEISENSNPITVYTNIESGRNIINTRNLYGDETRLLVQAFHKMGVRNFFMVGTTGALDLSFKISDVVIPGSIYNTDNNGNFLGKLDFESNYALTLQNKINLNADNMHLHSHHGWIQTLVDETKPRMISMQNSGVQSVDIETKYMAEFAQEHHEDNTIVGVALVVSDQPLGEKDYAESDKTKELQKQSAIEVIKSAAQGF